MNKGETLPDKRIQSCGAAMTVLLRWLVFLVCLPCPGLPVTVGDAPDVLTLFKSRYPTKD
jgi:hypothetical protein